MANGPPQSRGRRKRSNETPRIHFSHTPKFEEGKSVATVLTLTLKLPIHVTRRRAPCRRSPRTFASQGMSPSAPAWPRRSSSRMNIWVSSENQPPISPAKTTRLARPTSPPPNNIGGVRRRHGGGVSKSGATNEWSRGTHAERTWMVSSPFENSADDWKVSEGGLPPLKDKMSPKAVCVREERHTRGGGALRLWLATVHLTQQLVRHNVMFVFLFPFQSPASHVSASICASRKHRRERRHVVHSFVALAARLLRRNGVKLSGACCWCISCAGRGLAEELRWLPREKSLRRACGASSRRAAGCAARSVSATKRTLVRRAACCGPT